MSSSIDKRIVEMQFDNEKFKSGAKDTMKVLQDLDNNLNADRSGISKSLDFIADKFTVLGTMGRRAIENITDSLMGMGKNLVNDFVVEPKTQGFEEYELKMGSIQAIVNSVIKDFNSEAEAVEYVGEKLDALNKYADKTKYNFAQATASISKFTNAGVDLDSSVDAIQGILNLAASTGQGAEQANRAMYNFAQALGTGYLGALDWRSISDANMASMEFREELIKTGEAMGTLVKIGDKWQSTTTNAKGDVSDLFNAASIKDSLQAQWVTTDVLIETLKRYSNEETDVGKRATEAATRMYKFTETMDALKETVGSGWAKTWELIFGDFTESTNLWTAVYKSFNQVLEDQGNNRNALLQTWHKEYGGAKQMQTAVQNILDGITGFLGQIKEAWRSVFPPKTAEDLQKFGNTIVGLTERFKKAGTEGTALKDAVTVLAKIVKVAVNIFKIAGTVVKGIVKVLSPIGRLLGVIFDKINGFLSGIFSSFSEGKDSVDLVTKITNGITIAFDFLAEHLGNAVDWIINSMASTDDAINFGKSIVSHIKGFFSNLVSSFSSRSAGDIVKSISNIWKNIKDSISTGFTGLIDLIKNLASGMKEANFGTILDALNFGAIIALSIKIKSAITDFKDLIKTFKDISESLQDVLKNVSKVLGSVAKMFKAKANDLNAKAFLKVAAGIALLAVSLIALAYVDPETLQTVVTYMLTLAAAVTALMYVMNGDPTTKSWADNLASGFNTLTKSISAVALGVGLTAITLSLLALWGVILLFSRMSFETFAGGFLKIAAVFIVLGGGLSIFSTIAKSCAGPLIALGAALLMISAAMVVFFGVIMAFSFLEKRGNALESIGLALLTFVSIAGVLALGVIGLNAIKPEKLSGVTTGILKLSVAFMAIAFSMNLLVPAIAAFSLLAKHGGWEGFKLFGAVLLTVTLALLGLSVAVKIMGESGRYFGKIAVGIGLLAASFAVIALFAPMIIKNAADIKSALFILVNTICDVLIGCAPKIVEAIFKLITETLSVLEDAIPDIAVKIVHIVSGLLAVLAEYTPILTEQLYKIVKGMISTLFQLINADAPDSQVIGGIVLAVLGLTSMIKMMASAKMNLKDAAATLVFMLVLVGMVIGIFWAINQIGAGSDTVAAQAIAVGILLVAMASAMRNVSRIRTGGANFKTLFSSMIVFVVAAVLMMQSFRTIQDLDGWKMVPQAIAIGLVIAALGFAVGQAAKFNIKDIKQGIGAAISMLPFIGAMLASILVFKQLEGVDPVAMIEQAIAIGLLMVAMGVAAMLANKSDADVKKALGIAVELVVFLGVAIVLAIAFNELRKAGFKDSQGMIATAISMGIVIAAMGVAVMLANKTGTNAKKALGIAVELVALAVGVVAVAFALWLLKDADPDKMVVNAIALGALLFALVGCVWALSKINVNELENTKKKWGLLGQAVVLLLAAGGAVFVLAKFANEMSNPWALISQAAAIDLILVGLVGCVAALSKITASELDNTKKKWDLLGQAVVLLLASGGAVFLLAKFANEMTNPWALISQAVAIDLILVALAGCVWALSKINVNELENTKKKWGLLGQAVVLLLAAGGAVYALSNWTNADGIITKALALGIVLAELLIVTAVLAAISAIPGVSTSMGVPWKIVGETLIMLLAAGGTIYALDNFVCKDPASLVDKAIALGIILAALTITAAGISAISAIPISEAAAATASTTILAIGAIITAIVTVFGTISLAIEESGIQDYAPFTTEDIINRGVSLIGNVVGALGAGIVDGFIQAKSAWDKIESQNLIETVENLVNAAKIPFEQIGSLDVTSFSQKLPQFTDAIKTFFNNMTNAMSVEKAFIGLGVAETAEIIVGIADDIIDAAMRAKGANIESVNGLASLIEAFTTLGSAFNNSKDIQGKLSALMMPIAGYDNVFDALGAGVMAFYNNTKGMENSVVDKAVSASGAVTSLSEAVKNMKSMGNQQNDVLTSLITNLPRLGIAVWKYCEAIQNVEIDKVKDGIEATQSIVEVYKALYNLSAVGLDPVGSALTRVLHHVSVEGKAVSDFEVIVSDIDYFAEHMSSLASSMSVLGADDVRIGLDNLGGLMTICKDLAENNYDVYTFSKAFTDLAENGVSAFVDRFKNASEEVRNAVREMIGAATDEANRATTTGALNLDNAFDTNMISEWLGGNLSSDALGDMIFSGDVNTDDFQQKIQDALGIDITDIGIDIDGGSTGEQLSKKLDSILSDVNKKSEEGGYNIGQNTTLGMIDGMSDSKSDLSGITSELGKTVIASLKEQLGIASPSKETYKIGIYVIQGFINGIRDGTTYNNHEIASTMSSVLSTITSVFDDIENREWRPSITPIMDLDDIRSGMQWMDGTLNRLGINTSFGFDKANNIASSMSGVTDNAKLVGEVSNLNDRLGALETTLANGDLNNGVQTMSAEMSGLRDDIGSMMETMTNLKVVMNNDTVVGQLIGRIDTALGKRARLAARK